MFAIKAEVADPKASTFDACEAATVRSDDCGERLSRIRQIVAWLGFDFDGVIIFDEAHAMQNAVGAKGERGDQEPSHQGRAGLLPWLRLSILRMSRTLGWWMRGLGRSSPFFEDHTDATLLAPRVVTSGERTTL
jgi:hypothetical protein